MDARSLKQRYLDNLRSRSGLEAHWPYLGMSSINQCPRKLWEQFLNGRGHQSDRDHWFCRVGYLWQDEVLSLLDAPVERREVEVVAEFDARFRGHTDWEVEDDLVEVKSVGWALYKEVARSKMANRAHYEQVQMYLRHGGWDKAHVVYVARDVEPSEWAGVPMWVVTVYAHKETQARLDGKAQTVLEAIDRREQPDCQCGWCWRTEGSRSR